MVVCGAMKGVTRRKKKRNMRRKGKTKRKKKKNERGKVQDDDLVEEILRSFGCFRIMAWTVVMC